MPSPPSSSADDTSVIQQALTNCKGTGKSVVLADEPTGNLDNETSQDVQALLQELNRELGISFVIVTHDPNLAAKANRILRMDRGRLLA